MKYPFARMQTGDTKSKTFQTELAAKNAVRAAYAYAKRNNKRFFVQLIGCKVVVKYVCELYSIEHQPLYHKCKGKSESFDSAKISYLKPNQTIHIDCLRRVELTKYKQVAQNIAKARGWILTCNEQETETNRVQLAIIRAPAYVQTRRVKGLTRRTKYGFGNVKKGGYLKVELASLPALKRMQLAAHGFGQRHGWQFETKRTGNTLEIWRVK